MRPRLALLALIGLLAVACGTGTVSGTITTSARLTKPGGQTAPFGWAGPLPAVSGTSTSSFGVTVVGDSVSQDFTADSFQDGYVGRLDAALQAAYGDAGSGFQGVQYSQPGDCCANAYFVTATGAWVKDAYVPGIPGGEALGSAQVGSTLTWPAVDGTSVDVWYVYYPGASFTITVDGSNHYEPEVSCGVPSYCVAVVSAPVGTHVVTLTNDSTFFPIGVSGSNATGVRVDNLSLYGLTAGPFSAPGASAPGAVSDAMADMRSPKLVVVSLGLNDAVMIGAGFESIATFTISFNAILSAALATGAQVEIVVQEPSGYTGASLTAFGQVEAVELTAAKTLNLGVLDLYYRDGRDPCYYVEQSPSWGTLYPSSGHSDCGYQNYLVDVHPNTLGHAAIASVLRQAYGV